MIDYSGRMGYFSDRSIVNGDGIINSWDYLGALQAGELASWLSANEIDYFILMTDGGVGEVAQGGDEAGTATATLKLRDTPWYRLTAPTNAAVFHDTRAWIFPLSAITVSVSAEGLDRPVQRLTASD
jgi:hypothetical protein